MDVLSDIKNLKGIGPARTKMLNKLDIYSIQDLLFFFPRDYIDLSPLNFKQGREDETGAFPCIVTGTAVTKRSRSGITITKVPIYDGQNNGYAVFFNQPYIAKGFYRRQRLLLIGKIRKNFGAYEISSPEVVKFQKDSIGNLDRISPIYPLTKGLSQKMMRNIIKNALNCYKNLTETLPDEILKKYNLLPIDDTIHNIHFPQNFSYLKRAQERLVFEELLLFQLGLGLSRSDLKQIHRKNLYKNVDLAPLLSSLPFSLTSGQEKVIEDITSDLRSNHIMNRLVQGDVGSGKTIVACAALYLAVKNGLQGVMMAPTEILAQQHFSTLNNLLTPHDMRVGLLKGGMSEKARKQILLELETGQIDIIVGTHALIQEDVEFNKLGMVVTDEQHRFGVKQRKSLVKKGHYPDTLVMSATPIPRTVAMVLYSDLDISIIDTMPKGRQKVDTYVVNDSMKKRVYDFMVQEVKKGNLAYIVCPAVEENDLNIENVEELDSYIKKNYPQIESDILHGQLKPQEKDEVLEKFLSKQIQVLVSTTVVEVGVDVPAATLMIVEDAERFGLAQLHQLRGRVGRSSLKSYCILISNSRQETARERLRYMMSCHDGFKIAQKDLELRGPGEFLGVKQHGFFKFKLASFAKDVNILEMTKNLAEIILDKDLLSLPEYKNLKNALADCFKK